MALLPIYFDTVTKGLVLSRTSGTPVSLPFLNQEDAIRIEFTAVKRIALIGTPLEVIILTGYSLTISIGSAGTILAAANPGDFTINADNTVLTGTLDLNTSGINALANGAEQTFEIKLSNATERYRGQFAVQIFKSVNLAASVQPVVNDTALGRLEALRTYMKKEGDAGEGFILTSQDGAKKSFQYLHNDGSLRSEPLS